MTVISPAQIGPKNNLRDRQLRWMYDSVRLTTYNSDLTSLSSISDFTLTPTRAASLDFVDGSKYRLILSQRPHTLPYVPSRFDGEHQD